MTEGAGRVGWGAGGALLLARTFLLLLAAKIALRLVPVRSLLAFKQRHIAAAPARQDAAERALARRAVLAVVRRSPIEFVCFPQCLAASELLRARGIASRLHYGVARADGKLKTHTWLEAGGEIVIGGESAEDFSLLATY